MAQLVVERVAPTLLGEYVLAVEQEHVVVVDQHAVRLASVLVLLAHAFRNVGKSELFAVRVRLDVRVERLGVPEVHVVGDPQIARHVNVVFGRAGLGLAFERGLQLLERGLAHDLDLDAGLLLERACRKLVGRHHLGLTESVDGDFRDGFVHTVSGLAIAAAGRRKDERKQGNGMSVAHAVGPSLFLSRRFETSECGVDPRRPSLGDT
jgi:hypothetical protein